MVNITINIDQMKQGRISESNPFSRGAILHCYMHCFRGTSFSKNVECFRSALPSIFHSSWTLKDMKLILASSHFMIHLNQMRMMKWIINYIIVIILLLS